MTVSDWINIIRWKYFTNQKAGLIFKELMKEFRMVEQMTETGENIKGVITWNEKIRQWEYDDGDWCIDGKKKRVCDKCGKPCVDINGVEDADFCLQGLTDCEFISNACCGHGNDEEAYISLKDGRRFVLDK